VIASPCTAHHPLAGRLTPQAIGRAATLALHDELALAPKPGLVTFADPGSHADMDAYTFMRSLFALRRYFVRIAALGVQGAPFHELQQCGINAESRMMAATGGVNTHRGAIFMLGLLCAAAGAAFQKIAGPIDAPAYSDHEIEAGKSYRYAVSALDRTGNESARTAAVEIVAP